MIHSVPVVGAVPFDDDLLRLTLDVRATPLAAGYTEAGQFVTLSTAGSPPGFFAMASPPGDPRFEFLIRIERHKPKTASLAVLAPGDRVDVSDVQGEGYPLLAQARRKLLFVAGGTGIAPIRASLAVVLPVKDRFERITLVYGAGSEEALAFADEHEGWRKAGVQFIPCVSHPTAEWKGAVGYVTDALDDMPIEGAKTTAIVCGPDAMVTPVTVLLKKRGVPANRIFVNA